MKLINSIKTLALAAAAAFGITGAAWGKTVQVTEVSYAALKTAVDGADSGDIIEIAAAGTYQMPTVYPDEGLSIPKNVTIVGTVEGVVFDYSGIPNSTDISFGYVSSGATFSNIEFKLGGIADNYEGIYRGWQKPQPSTGTIVFRDCSFSGIFSIYKAPTVFENCAFKQVTNTYFMWVYDNSTVSFVRCTFNYISKCIHLYNEGGQVAWNVYAEDCKFYPSDPNSSSNKGVFNTKNANPQSVNIILNSCETTDTVHGLVQLEVQSKSNTTIAIGHDIVLDENGDIVSGECSTLVIGSDADPIISSDSDTINNGDGTYTIKNTQSAPTEKEEVQVDVSGTIEATVVDANGNEISATPAQQTAADNKKTATAEAIAANTSAASKTGTGLRNVDESAYLKVELTSTVIEVVDDDASLKTLVFDVTPYKVTETTSDSETTKTEVELTVVDTPITFRLPLTDDFTISALITHEDDADRVVPVQGEPGQKYVELTFTHFSKVTATPTDKVESSIQSTAELGIIRYSSANASANLYTNSAEVAVGVPWLSTSSTSESAVAVTVAELIATGLTTDDQISVWDKANKRYDVWQWNGSAWEAARDADSGNTKSAYETRVERGQAFWYKRAEPSKTFALIGRPKDTATTTPDAGAAANPKYNLMSNPYPDAIDLAGLTGAEGDQIVTIPEGTFYTYTAAKSGWCTREWVDAPTVWNPNAKKESLVKQDPLVISAGRSFWYISKSGQPTIDWKKLKVTE